MMKYWEDFQKDGKILTVYFPDNKQGIYDRKNGNIGINHFLNRISPTNVHECVHKIGYEVADLSFVKLNSVIREAGAELVSARALSFGNEGREIVADGLAAKIPEMTSTEFLEVALLGQLDYVVGNQKLEETILSGKDIFTPALISKYGEQGTVYLLENLNDIERLYQKDEKVKKQLLYEKIEDFQNNLLHFEFDDRLNNVSSLNAGQEFLTELLNFGECRIKTREKLERTYYKDQYFEKYFENCKHTIEREYGQTGIKYDEEEWVRKYGFKPMIPETSYEERMDILKLSVEFAKTHKKKGIFAKLLKGTRKCDEPKSLPESTNCSETPEFINTLAKYNINNNIVLEYSNMPNPQKNKKSEMGR